MLKNGRYLITTSEFFMAPDGEQYKAVWGDCEVIQAKDALGFTPARSSNWLIKVGAGRGHVIIAGCQVNYAVECIEPPKRKDGVHSDNNCPDRKFPNNIIYFAQSC